MKSKIEEKRIEQGGEKKEAETWKLCGWQRQRRRRQKNKREKIKYLIEFVIYLSNQVTCHFFLLCSSLISPRSRPISVSFSKFGAWKCVLVLCINIFKRETYLNFGYLLLFTILYTKYFDWGFVVYIKTYSVAVVVFLLFSFSKMKRAKEMWRQCEKVDERCLTNKNRMFVIENECTMALWALSKSRKHCRTD